jgi:acyl transferase domain-containing protein
MIDQWAEPIRFRETIETMYADGVRVFLEVGPRGNLTGFVDDILAGRA